MAKVIVFTDHPALKYLFAKKYDKPNTSAFGLHNVVKLIEDGSLAELVRKRYQSFDIEIGAEVEARKSDVEMLEKKAKEWGEPKVLFANPIGHSFASIRMVLLDGGNNTACVPAQQQTDTCFQLESQWAKHQHNAVGLHQQLSYENSCDMTSGHAIFAVGCTGYAFPASFPTSRFFEVMDFGSKDFMHVFLALGGGPQVVGLRDCTNQDNGNCQCSFAYYRT